MTLPDDPFGAWVVVPRRACRNGIACIWPENGCQFHRSRINTPQAITLLYNS
jgi:hypothetical protein